MEVHVLEALSDNYMYLIVDTVTKQAAAVDPADADICAAAANTLGVSITTVLTTHHHYDHAGGNKEMKRLLPGIVVVGGKGDAVQGMTYPVVDGETISIGDAVTISCLHTPCHTNGHMSYIASAPGVASAVFTGDILFVGGCGRFFEGGPEDMCASVHKLSALLPETRLYCGHEYTVKNLQFALDVDPENADIQRKMLWAQQMRKEGNFTVPSTIGEELKINPFMRVSQSVVRSYCGGTTDDVLTMRRLRNKKDNFAGSSRPWVPGGGPLPGL